MTPRRCGVALALSVGLSGCITAVEKDFEAYQPVPMTRADLTQANTGELRQAKQKVAVFAHDEADSPMTKSVNVKGAMEAQIEAYVQKAGMEIVSRRQSERQAVAEESRMYKFLNAGEGRYTGPKDATWVVMGIVTSIDAAGEYVAPVKMEKYTQPAKCNYTATLTGTLRVYNVADARVVSTVNLHGTGSRSVDTTSASCAVTSNVLPLVRGASEDALERQRAELQTLFSQRGYVVDKRVSKKTTIFKVSLGKLDGLEPGSKVEIFTRFLSTDQLTGKARAEERKIADGKVTDFVNEDAAWIIVNVAAEGERIRAGDHVKVIWDEGMLDRFRRLVPMRR